MSSSSRKICSYLTSSVGVWLAREGLFARPEISTALRWALRLESWSRLKPFLKKSPRIEWTFFDGGSWMRSESSIFRKNLLNEILRGTAGSFVVKPVTVEAKIKKDLNDSRLGMADSSAETLLRLNDLLFVGSGEWMRYVSLSTVAW